jgi:hypothetical protein
MSCNVVSGIANDKAHEITHDVHDKISFTTVIHNCAGLPMIFMKDTEEAAEGP